MIESGMVTKCKVLTYLGARRTRYKVNSANTAAAQVLALEEALGAARAAGRDLVEVQPRAEPPVCRLQDFGKAQYAAKLREKVSTLFQTCPSTGSLLLGCRYRNGCQQQGMPRCRASFHSNCPSSVTLSSVCRRTLYIQWLSSYLLLLCALAHAEHAALI